MARSVADKELLRALKGRKRCLPVVSDAAKRRFYEIAQKTGLKWSDLQRKARRGENVFDLKRYRVFVIDVRMLAAGERNEDA